MKKFLFLIMFLSFFKLFGKSSYSSVEGINFHGSAYLSHLLEENKKFVKETDKDVFKETSKGQQPEAIVISCSDSRVYVEKIFNKQIGDFFVIRTAGHVIGDVDLESVELALSRLGIRKIIILGHTHCGAVQEAIGEKSKKLKKGKSNAIVEFINKSYNEVTSMCGDCCSSDEIYAQTISMNVFKTSDFLISHSRLVRKLLKKKELEIFHLRYDIENGTINDLDINEIRAGCKSKNKKKKAEKLADDLRNKGDDIKVGSIAPNFEIDNQFFKGSLYDFYENKANQDKYIVLYFYPKDNTPGCTFQAKGFRDLQNKMIENGIYTIGVSMDTEEEHKNFTESKDLNYQLIADTNGSLSDAYKTRNNGFTSFLFKNLRITYIIGYNEETGFPEIQSIEDASVFSNAQDSLEKVMELKQKKRNIKLHGKIQNDETSQDIESKTKEEK